MKKSVVSLAVIFVFMLGALPSYAGKNDNTCFINGVKYSIGNVIAKFGKNAKIIKACCDCGNTYPLCGGGYIEDYNNSGIEYPLTVIAAKHNHYQCLKYLIGSCGGGVNSMPWGSRKRDYVDLTPIMYAVKNGNVEMVKYLLSKGADKYRKNEMGESAVDMAKKSGNQEIIEALNSNSYSKLMDLKYKQEIIKMLKLNDHDKEEALADLGLRINDLI